MKRIFFTGILLLGLSSAGFSQQRHDMRNLTPEERAQRRTEMLSKRLSLTKEQQEKVYAINLEEAKRMEKFKAEAQEDRQKRMEAARTSMKDSEDKISDVLTPEQKKNYESLQAQREERMKNGRNHAHPKRERVQKEKQ